MITNNNIELTDNEYKEQLLTCLNTIIKEFEEKEDFELCEACLVMINDIDNQTPEVIKHTLTNMKVLMEIRKIQQKYYL